jgi:hypothetical protein
LIPYYICFASNFGNIGFLQGMAGFSYFDHLAFGETEISIWVFDFSRI